MNYSPNKSAPQSCPIRGAVAMGRRLVVRAEPTYIQADADYRVVNLEGSILSIRETSRWEGRWPLAEAGLGWLLC